VPDEPKVCRALRHTLMACMCTALHCWQANLNTIFFVVLACKQQHHAVRKSNNKKRLATAYISVNNDWLALKDIADADRNEQQGGAAAHLLVKDRLSLTTIACLLSVVPPLTCSLRKPITPTAVVKHRRYCLCNKADYILAINPGRLGLTSTQPHLGRTS